jgi:hypothetical protein
MTRRSFNPIQALVFIDCHHEKKRPIAMRKRNLSEAQIAWKVKINRRIVSKTVVRKRIVR